MARAIAAGPPASISYHRGSDPQHLVDRRAEPGADRAGHLRLVDLAHLGPYRRCRGRAIAHDALNAKKGALYVAVCDVDGRHRQNAVEDMKKAGQEVKAYKDFHELLDNKEASHADLEGLLTSARALLTPAGQSTAFARE